MLSKWQYSAKDCQFVLYRESHVLLNVRLRYFNMQKMNKDNSEEIFPIVDESGFTIGKATRGECHGGSKLLHPVVHLHVFNPAGDLYLQKRPDWKDIQPGKWDTAVGGHIDYDENVKDALEREAFEELGLKGFTPVSLGNYVFESDKEREFVNSFKTVIESVPSPSKELDGGRFWSREDILASLGKGIFTPNFEKEYVRFFGIHD